MIRYLTILGLGFGCRSDAPPSEGTVVGNPGDGAMRSGEGADFETAEAKTAVSTMLWKGCSGGEREVAKGSEIDLLGDNLYSVPAGSRCAVVVNFSDSLIIEGPFSIDEREEEEEEEEEEFWLQMELSIDQAVFVPDGDSFSLSGEHLVMELGEPGWFDPDALLDVEDVSAEARLALEEGLLIVDEDHPAHIDLVDSVENDSTLHVDDDGDGLLSDQERDAGPVAQGDSDTDLDDKKWDSSKEKTSSEDEGGCGSGGSGAWLLLPLGWCSRRRLLGHR